MDFATTVVGVITAVASVITAMGLLIGSLAAYIKVKRLQNTVDTVHTLVNQQQTDLRNYQRALIEALREANIAVPVDQSRKEA
jgi:hypothetical protein